MNRKIIGKISSSLIKADASYIPFHKYNPLINYDWSTKNINGLRYLTDKGKSPKYDAQLYFGQGVYFNGVDQKVDYGTLPTSSPEVSMTITGKSIVCNHKYNFWIKQDGFAYYLADGVTLVVENITYNIANTYTFNITPTLIEVFENGVKILTRIPQSILSGGDKTIGVRKTSFYASVIKDAYMFNRVLSQSEITQSYEQPEAFYAMAQADSTCVLNMPMCENDGYVRNMKSYTEYELPYNNTREGYITSNHIKSIVASKSIVNKRIRISDDSTTTNTPRFLLTSDSTSNTTNILDNDCYYRVDVKIGAVFQHSDLRLKYGCDQNLNGGTSYNSVNLADLASHTIIIKATNINGGGIGVLANATGSVETTSYFDIDYFIVTKLTGIQPIQNYTTACRTSAQQLSYGLQTCKFNRDSLGVIQSASQFLECKGLGYVDTGWIPPTNKDFTIECIIYLTPNLTYQQNGSGNLSNAKIHFGLWNDNKPYIQGRSPSTFYGTVLTNPTSMYFSIVKSGTINKLYMNNNLIASESDSQISESMSFLLGKRASFISYSPIRLFKVHDKALTQAEITKNYNSYVAKGLLA